MIRVQTPDGRTEVLDLSDAQRARAFLRSEVTALALVRAGGRCRTCGRAHPESSTTLVLPAGFKQVSLNAELVSSAGSVRGGERLVAFCDEAQLVVMSHAEAPAVRILLSKPGRRKFAPVGR